MRCAPRRRQLVVGHVARRRAATSRRSRRRRRAARRRRTAAPPAAGRPASARTPRAGCRRACAPAGSTSAAEAARLLRRARGATRASMKRAGSRGRSRPPRRRPSARRPRARALSPTFSSPAAAALARPRPTARTACPVAPAASSARSSRSSRSTCLRRRSPSMPRGASSRRAASPITATANATNCAPSSAVEQHQREVVAQPRQVAVAGEQRRAQRPPSIGARPSPGALAGHVEDHLVLEFGGHVHGGSLLNARTYDQAARCSRARRPARP